MKEIIALFLAAFVAASASAHGSHGSHGSPGDSGGLSAGLDFNLHIHRHEHEGEEAETEVAPNAALALAYSEGFFDDKLEFNIGLSYGFNFLKGYFDLDHDYGHEQDEHDGHGHNHSHDHDLFAHRDFFQQALFLHAGLTYSLDVLYFSKLSFVLENDTGFYLSPRIGEENNTEGILRPGMQWSSALNFGEIHVRYDVPLHYVYYFKGEEFGVGSDITLGWQSKFGLGIDCTGRFLLLPETGFDGVDAIVSYAIPIKNFEFYINLELEGIGGEENPCIVPMVGFRYKF
jgi:hypothetical protein